MRRTYRKHKFDSNICMDVAPLYELDNWHAPLALLFDFAVIAAAFLATRALGWAVYPVAILIIGSRQRALSTIVHEAAHGTLCRSRALAGLLATVFSGFPLLSTLKAYKSSHLAGHHGCFGAPNLDPDYQYMVSKGVYDIRDERRLTWEIIVKPFLLLNVPSYLMYVIRARSFSVGNHAVAREHFALCAYWIIIVGCALRFGQGWNLLLFWIIPLLTTFQVIGWFIELAEHSPLMRNGINLHMTRNRNSSLVELFLTGMHAESYHLAHHLWPRVPFWNMAKLHRVLLRDPDYWRWNNSSGGIFFSSNRAPSVIALLQQRCGQPRFLRCAML